ncbi:MAG: phosphopyruvate hydratase [Chloroflexi bacterium]|nr:phosphopyruvate hydratase [Chloroflexota bacterium]
MSLKIAQIHGREILDSRGRPTVEVEVTLEGGWSGLASVPSGASTGSHEALELRDGGIAALGGAPATRLRGRGVRRAVQHVNEIIAPHLVGYEALNQVGLDAELIALDGTATKSRLGANALLGVSLGVARAASNALHLPLWRYLGGAAARVLPLPMINMISGGLHAARNLDFQDFLIMAIGAHSYSEALEMCLTVHQMTSDLLAEKGLSTLKADEGGFGPALSSNHAALDLLMEAIERAGYKPGVDIAFAIDVAATHFYHPEDNRYHLASEHQVYNADEMVALLETWVEQYPILSIEDGLAEDDWEGWQTLTNRLGSKVQILGDDLFTTNAIRLRQGIQRKVGNAILVKMNQIGTLSETLAVVDLARRAGYRPVISARSGETEDSTLADLAVATNAGQIKIGSLAQSERLAKYNQLLRIEEELGSQGIFLGKEILER